jgi:hypothetical protein
MRAPTRAVMVCFAAGGGCGGTVAAGPSKEATEPNVVVPRLVETEQFIDCTHVPSAGDAVCSRQDVSCGESLECEQTTAAYCTRSQQEWCFGGLTRCLERVRGDRNAGIATSECYMLHSTAPVRYTPPQFAQRRPYRPSTPEIGSREPIVNATPIAPPVPSVRVLVFGGRDHKTFLGCLCGDYESDSVTYEYGQFGSRYATESIWNHYGEYGSPYIDTSACNSYANEPPVVVTSDGKFIGYLTLNEYKAGAITEGEVLKWLKEKVCAD